MDGIEQKRAAQVVAGALLVDVLLKDLAPERVRLSPHALREGMVVHFIQQNYERLEQLAPYVDVRRRSIDELGFRYRWEERHVVHVTTLALQLFDACQDVHGMGEHERELLEYASLLHDIGYYISRSSHHKHSFYLIKNADLRGFQPEEVDILAHVTRYHRGALPKDKHVAFQRLPKDLQKTILKLAAFLRLAEGLDRSHFQNVVRLEVELAKKQLKLMLETKSDPQLDAWGARRGGDLFEQLYERKVLVEAHVLRRGEAAAMA
jgi:exopolyphosphatase/guanosine-5'-triphosphate,3'-diphosphate pyrophosphatase